MKFRVEIDVEVADHDADLVLKFPDAVTGRFAGTAFKINYISVSKEEDQA